MSTIGPPSGVLANLMLRKRCHRCGTRLESRKVDGSRSYLAQLGWKEREGGRINRQTEADGLVLCRACGESFRAWLVEDDG